MVGKTNLPADADEREDVRGSATETPGLTPIDQEREASMADEGGTAGAAVERENRPTDDDTVEGDMVRPDGEMVDTRRGAKHSSLIKIRENFIPEMLKSVEGI